MIATPASAERVQKCVFNFEIHRFLKKAANLPHPPLLTARFFPLQQTRSPESVAE